MYRTPPLKSLGASTVSIVNFKIIASLPLSIDRIPFSFFEEVLYLVAYKYGINIEPSRNI